LAGGGIGTTSICCVVLSTAEVYTLLTLTFSASSLNFGVLQIGLTSASQTVIVTNVSNHSVMLTGIMHSGDFGENNYCPIPGTLNVNQNCSITASFTPTAAGLRNGAITLNDNSTGSPQQTIALSGTGGAGALTFTSPSLNLGNVIPGNSSTQNATLINDSAGEPICTKSFSSDATERSKIGGEDAGSKDRLDSGGEVVKIHVQTEVLYAEKSQTFRSVRTKWQAVFLHGEVRAHADAGDPVGDGLGC
jgi:hypothetical protein